MMYRKTYSSPIGLLEMESDGTYLTGLWFGKSQSSTNHDTDWIEKDLPIFESTSHWLDIYFAGKIPDFTPKYKILNATPFRKQVIDIICRIPYGKVVTYKDIADQIARSRGLKRMSAQAVGGAVGWNPICIIIPCHRVVGSTGNLTGYAGGIAKKVRLLEIENHLVSEFKIKKNEEKSYLI